VVDLLSVIDYYLIARYFWYSAKKSMHF